MPSVTIQESIPKLLLKTPFRMLGAGLLAIDTLFVSLAAPFETLGKEMYGKGFKGKEVVKVDDVLTGTVPAGKVKKNKNKQHNIFFWKKLKAEPSTKVMIDEDEDDFVKEWTYVDEKEKADAMEGKIVLGKGEKCVWEEDGLSTSLLADDLSTASTEKGDVWVEKV
jgi:hypothetical protein